MNQPVSPTLRSYALLFFRLGAIGFGGGMAVVALLEAELIQRRKFMEMEEFLHGVALGQILGPFAVNTSFFVGYRRFGLPGALACTGAFLAPSVAMVTLLAWLYFTFHTMPALQATLLGLGPVVIALILSAAWSMGRKAVQSWPAGFLTTLALAMALFKVSSLATLAAGAAVGLWAGKDVLSGKTRMKASQGGRLSAFAFLGGLPAAAPLATSLSGTAWLFLKIGLLFFGGGFVLVPVLHQHLVVSLGWLTPREFLDGVAISNLTPGPIAVLATFAGYRVQGVLGALAATAALFTPALVLMGLLSHFYGRLKDLRLAQNLLAGLTPVVVGLILGAAALLAPGAIRHWQGAVLFILALALLLRWRWHPAFVLGLGALAGAVGFVR
ncbi:chromate efflux transporter [Mesoterricola silvestris]|uniref:Chromate transporter n=1 Tax=Mesoterricola silvestris TaxID=2927979 RepID=A0AA48GXI9_9BACT|nr:chromate efflux transporter [Mesoterricola silvestris]BDU72178.1 hypothetical protein METEAL_13520 [Mesoterricola silvestris]